jgi:TyrR family helix-turn-helix protein
MDFNNRFNTLYGKEKRFSQQAIEKMVRYDWPGNVRELEHMVERLVLTAEGPTIEVKDLPDVVLGSRKRAVTEGKTLSEMMDAYEAEIINHAYAKCKSSTKLAEYLGISQPTAVRKIQKYVREAKE